MLFGAGLSFGLAFWGLIAATGMGAVLQGSASLLATMKIAGGLYLLWLAFKSARSALRETDNQSTKPDQRRWFVRGLVLNLSNPKAVVAWMAALSMGLEAGDHAASVITATLLCMALGFLNYTGYAMAFSLPGVMAEYKRPLPVDRWCGGRVVLRLRVLDW